MGNEHVADDAGAGLFQPVRLGPYYNASRHVTGERWGALAATAAALPAGRQRFWGVPFELAAERRADSLDGGSESGPADSTTFPAWVLLGEAAGQPVDLTAEVPGAARAPSYLVFLHVCELPTETVAAFQPGRAFHQVPPLWLSQAGQQIAAYTLVYEDGSEHTQPVRWRFEINNGWPGRLFDRQAFAARGHLMDAPLDIRGPYPRGGWADHQTSLQRSTGTFWVYALPNPHHDRPLRAVRLAATGEAAVGVAGVTLFYGHDHPLRHRALQSFRVHLPAATPDAERRSHRDAGAFPPARESAVRERAAGVTGVSGVETSIDLGIIARQYAVPAFDPDPWLAGREISSSPPASLPAEPVQELLLDITASADATLRVAGHDVPLRDAFERGAARSRDGSVRVELLAPATTWLQVTIEDGATGKPTPARVHFRAPDGRYLPPYGHRHEVNDQWFEDYGADLKVHGTQYAYVDGTFQAGLPVGDVYVELFKGFEYQPQRQRLAIRPGQRELTLRIDRAVDWRQDGWVTADTHVHFLSPHTAQLEGRAEGVNVIHLLASQWGDLFTNVGDITGEPAFGDGDTLVWVGTENRQHLLGHLGLLGVKGAPVYPMTTGGPPESFLGDVTWTSLAGWAEEARRRGGLAVAAHFPTPYCEVAADIVLGKLDAVELNAGQFAMRVQEWYRYLNLGYRLTAVAGTDKMSAGTAVGAIRTYARLDGDAPLTFDSWTKAVRAGRTFTTTGPLVDLRVEGRSPGEEIRLPPGGGSLHVEVRAESVVPFHALEVVMNGRVVAAQPFEGGRYRCKLEVPLHVPGTAWIAARCSSRLERWIGSRQVVAAHTSPVYVVAGNDELFDASGATYLLTMLEGGLTWLDTLSIAAGAEHHARIRRVFQDALGHVHDRLHRHGHGHRHGHAPNSGSSRWE